MKKILYFLLAGIILTAVIWACEKNSNEQKSQDASNNGTPKKLRQRDNSPCLDTTCCTLVGTGLTRSFRVLGYEPCVAIVTYDQYQCTNCGGSTIVRILFDNFHVSLNDDSCTVLKNRWDSLHTATNYSQENAEMDAFNKAAEKKLEDIVIKGWFPNHPMDSFPCNGTVYFFGTEYVSGMCYVWCVTNFPSATPPYTSLTKLFCGDICCLKQTLWCNDGNGMVQHGDPSYSEHGTTCGSQYSSCSGGSGSPRTVGTTCDTHTCDD
ncbi:MAG: hypothetical protein IPO16_13110 [Saprospiraceae bacterium]|nr:hypothetical protein [Saprospiraceae bacterium]